MAFTETNKHITLTEFLEETAGDNGDRAVIISALASAYKLISAQVRKAGLNKITGLENTLNSNGDQVTRLDKYAENLIINEMFATGLICAMVSEETEGLITNPEYKDAPYVLLFDPIDGSTNIDVDVTIGSLFSIYRRISKGTATGEDALQCGRSQIAAGYVLYGGSTVLTLTTGSGVNIFTSDCNSEKYYLTFADVRMPEAGRQYSCNEGNFHKWNDRARAYVEHIKTPDSNGDTYNFRYIATAVADIHRLLHYGGIYLYPDGETMPQGKIRLLYEANPLAMIIEQAGGRAIGGAVALLDIKPQSLHQKVPFYVGSKTNIDELEQFLNGTNPKQNSGGSNG